MSLGDVLDELVRAIGGHPPRPYWERDAMRDFERAQKTREAFAAIHRNPAFTLEGAREAFSRIRRDAKQ